MAGDTKVPLPDGPGRETVIKICGACHGVDIAVSRRESPEGWNAIILKMIKRGAEGTDDEFGDIVDYLAAHYPKTEDSDSTGKIAVNTATAKELENAFGITGKEASAIVRHRDDKGKFKSFGDLTKVPGLDAAKLEAKKDAIVF